MQLSKRITVNSYSHMIYLAKPFTTEVKFLSPTCIPVHLHIMHFTLNINYNFLVVKTLIYSIVYNGKLILSRD